MNEVARWLRDGAEVCEGLRLLSLYEPNPFLESIVSKQPRLFAPQLRKTLSKYADEIPETQALRSPDTGYKFREEWPFLSHPDCPMELKILAADKITAYHATVEMHRKLFFCSSQEECFETAKNLLRNFSQNRQITAEFMYYRENGSLLGKHPIFQEMKKYDNLRKMSVVRLTEERTRLKGAIWRIEHEVSKGDKPHLKDTRLDRLSRKRHQLEAVEQMITESDKPR